MKKLLFIIPPYFNADDYLNKNRAAVLPSFTMPYGILSMETYLSANCRSPVDLQLLDLNITLQRLVAENYAGDYIGEFSREVVNRLREFNPQFVGVSALFNSSNRYIQDVVKTCKGYDPNIFTLAGGGLPSTAYKLMLEGCPDLDAICKGEGELPMRDLLDADDPWQIVRTHKSWICRDGLAANKIPQHTFIENLDNIPPFNFDGINLDFYNNRSIDKQYAGRPKSLFQNSKKTRLHGFFGKAECTKIGCLNAAARRSRPFLNPRPLVSKRPLTIGGRPTFTEADSARLLHGVAAVGLL
jgi:anaerobic magnesium-protoporphyrin IX monomethyl ester cyclase